MSNIAHRKSRSRRFSRRAFTLVEVLTVVVILAIVAALAMPDAMQQQSLTTSAVSRVVLSDLLFAQSEAVSTGQYQYVSFTVASTQAGGTSGSYSLSSPFGTVMTNPVSQQAYSQSFGSGAASPFASCQLADLMLDNAANTVLVFNELGQPLVCAPNGTPVLLANTGTIVVQCGSIAVTLSIEPGTGNITVSSAEGV